MQRFTRFWVLLLALAAVVAACDDQTTGPGGGATTAGRTIYGVDASNNLIAFGALTPGTRISQTAITGLAAGETVVGIDFRPADDALYALTTSSRLYTINASTGAATAASGGAFTPGLSGTAFGFGFNPQVDRVRIHSDSDQNLRLNQTATPIGVITDTTLAYIQGDANFGVNPTIVGTAYTLSLRAAPSSTELFAIDSNRDVLVRVERPNGGVLRTVGSLGVSTSEAVGFDIAGDTDVAYVTLTPADAPTGASRLYVVNLRNGAATLVGAVGHATPLRSIALAPGATTAFTRSPPR